MSLKVVHTTWGKKQQQESLSKPRKRLALFQSFSFLILLKRNKIASFHEDIENYIWEIFGKWKKNMKVLLTTTATKSNISLNLIVFFSDHLFRYQAIH